MRAVRVDDTVTDKSDAHRTAYAFRPDLLSGRWVIPTESRQMRRTAMQSGIRVASMRRISFPGLVIAQAVRPIARTIPALLRLLVVLPFEDRLRRAILAENLPLGRVARRRRFVDRVAGL